MVDKQAPRVRTRTGDLKKKLLRGEFGAVLEQPSATSFTFLCIDNQGWAWVRVKGQRAEAWTGHVIGGPMAPGLGGQGSPRSMTVAT